MSEFCHQYVVNHQMQADSIAKHLSTASVTSISYESYVETICTFCQTIDHTNHKAVQEKSQCKALQAESTGAEMVIGVVEVVVVAATLGEGVDVNLTKLVVAMVSTTIGSLKINLITWMRKDTNGLSGTVLLMTKFKPLDRILIPLVPLLQPLSRVPPRPLHHRYRYLVPQLYQRHNLSSLGHHHLWPH